MFLEVDVSKTWILNSEEHSLLWWNNEQLIQSICTSELVYKLRESSAFHGALSATLIVLVTHQRENDQT
jgi:hypothetical protein